ncbi:MAG: extracellular solute-binding protein, partial [Acidimicrobiia bacterium]
MRRQRPLVGRQPSAVDRQGSAVSSSQLAGKRQTAFGKQTSILLLTVTLALAACGGGSTGSLTVYSGRSEELVGPVIDRFEQDTGIDVKVRYAGSTELAATLLEEGDNSPADVFFAQDPASLGAVAGDGLFAQLSNDIMALVPERFADDRGRWVGVSARARVVVYDTTTVSADELPATTYELTDPRWQGRLGVAPTNGSFLAFVGAMILADGEEATLQWLKGIEANDPLTYDGNSTIVAAVDRGEVELGLVNHYYLFRLLDERGSSDAANHFLRSGDHR